jgi:hypothetical protein
VRSGYGVGIERERTADEADQRALGTQSRPQQAQRLGLEFQLRQGPADRAARQVGGIAQVPIQLRSGLVPQPHA